MKLDKSSLPLIEEIFGEVKESTVFTTLDLFQGYWQIKMYESCKEMTNCICRYGTFQFEGLRCNVPENDGQLIGKCEQREVLCGIRNCPFRKHGKPYQAFGDFHVTATQAWSPLQIEHMFLLAAKITAAWPCH